MAKKSAKKKSAKTKKSSIRKKTSIMKPAAGPEAFVDHLENNKQWKARLRKGWNEVIQMAKKKGFKFNKTQLREHLVKRYGVTSLPKDDEPDTCICI
jgi:hypothetical protein